MTTRRMFTAFIALQAAVVSAGAPLEVKLLDVKKIWDAAPHNAFTDLVRWNEQFYCAFREGRGHVSADGRIRVLSSQDAGSWTSTGLIELAGYDLRDAHLSVTPDNRLMLLGGASPREKDGQMPLPAHSWRSPEMARSGPSRRLSPSRDDGCGA